MNFDQYKNCGWKNYKALSEEVKSILSAKIAETKRYNLQQIQNRPKENKSVERKLRKRNQLDTSDIQSVCKDLAGCRIIFYNNFDVECFGYDLVIPDLFDVDIRRTKFHVHEFDEQDARKMFESYNFVVSLREDHEKHKQFAGMFCEIQVQTVLNHAWSELAHDTIYKPLDLDGNESNPQFQTDLQKFRKLKNDFIAPAGRLAQIIINDHRRDMKGKDRFERQTLGQLFDAETNKERYNALKKLKDELIPNFDDIEPEISEIRFSLEKTWRKVHQKFETVRQNRETEDLDLAEITKLIIDLFERFWKYGPDITYSIIVRLYVFSESDSSRDQLVDLARHMSRNTKDEWEKHGPLVQLIIARKLENEPYLVEAGEVICAFAKEILSTEVTGDEFKQDKVIMYRGSVAYSEELGEARKIAINCLFEILTNSGNASLTRLVLNNLLSVPNLPVTGRYEEKLAETVVQDSIDVVQRLQDKIPTDDFEYLHEIEEELYSIWIWTKRLTDKHRDNEVLLSLSDELSKSIMRLAKEVNANSEFLIYKVLVAITPYFEPHWAIDVRELDDHPGELGKISHDYRSHEIKRLCNEVNSRNYDIWKERLTRLFANRTLGPATFDPMEEFLRLVAGNHPNFVFDLLLSRNELPDWTVTPFATILSDTVFANQTVSILSNWVHERKYLTEVSYVFSNPKSIGSKAITECVEVAIGQGEIKALSALSGTAALNYKSDPDFWRDKVFLPVVTTMINLGSNEWIDSTWFLKEKPSIYGNLNQSQKNLIVDAFVRMKENDSNVECIVVALSSGSPVIILDWIEKRLERSEKLDDDDYEVFPTEQTWFHLALHKHPREVISAVKQWSTKFDISKHWEITEFLKSVFIDCYKNLEATIFDMIEFGDAETLLFLVTSLQGFEGNTVLVH